MLLEQFEQHCTRFVATSLQPVHASQVQVRLIEGWRNPNALFETGHCLIPPLRPQIEHAQVIQCFGVYGADAQRLLQILVGTIAVVDLRENHAQAVICLGIVRADFHGSL